MTWRKAFLSLPRLVPDAALYLTSPEGPQPTVVNIPSRGQHTISLYIFIPLPPKQAPLSVSDEAPKLPVLIDFHGGGFIFGSCQEQAPFCSMMSRELNAISISVDYRLGPAAKFPAAVEDAEDVVNAVLDPLKPGYTELRYSINQVLLKASRPRIDLDTSRIAISGFSSGGNLALNLGLSINTTNSVHEDWPSVLPNSFARDIPLLLFFPSLDCRLLPSERPRPPGMEKEKPSFLKALELESTVMPTYLPKDQAAHPRASPGLAEIKNGGLHEKAKMLLVLPEWDTLAEQSDVWIEKVGKEDRAADLTVEKIKGVTHGWTQFPDSWLSVEHRKLKVEIFEKARDLVAKVWA